MSTSKTFERLVPAGDTHERDVCRTCGFINYQNPRIVVGSVVRHEGKVLLCRRAIEPRRGFWTVPAGYLELNETPEDGARREAREEAMANLELGDLLPLAGVEYVTGFESQDETGEPHAPTGSAQPDNVQALTWVMALGYDSEGEHVIDKPNQYDRWAGFEPELSPPATIRA